MVAEQTGEFDRSKGQAVMEQLIQSHPDITAVYAENDEMGVGAVNALKTAGKAPGKDVKVVSIDGTRNAVQLIADGSYNAVIESNPRFGPLAFQTLQKFEGGEADPGEHRDHRRPVRRDQRGPEGRERVLMTAATEEDVAMTTAPVLEVAGVTKRFPGTLALDDVSFALRPGEVHALVGENGAGKSTLIKVLTGVYQPDEGEVRHLGEPVTFKRPIDAQRAGISTIYQEVNLVPLMSIAGNVFLGREPRTRTGLVDWAKMYADARELLKGYGIDDDVKRPLHTPGCRRAADGRARPRGLDRRARSSSWTSRRRRSSRARSRRSSRC